MSEVTDVIPKLRRNAVKDRFAGFLLHIPHTRFQVLKFVDKLMDDITIFQSQTIKTKIPCAHHSL